MGKTIREKIIDVIESVPVSRDSSGIPCIRLRHFNTLVELLKENDFGGIPNERTFSIEPKEKVVAYSYQIAVDTKLYADKLFHKYQRKVDKFIKNSYKKLWKVAKKNDRKL